MKAAWNYRLSCAMLLLFGYRVCQFTKKTLERKYAESDELQGEEEGHVFVFVK
jgi:hypothetical protein